MAGGGAWNRAARETDGQVRAHGRRPFARANFAFDPEGNRYLWVDEDNGGVFDAHNHAFRVLAGVPRRGIYDNMRTAVDKVGRGKDRQVNARFSAMVSHFLFEAEFCNPASGWEKGQIEKNVQGMPAIGSGNPRRASPR